MAMIASRALRNETRAVLQRVEAGEDVTITVDGRPVATLHRLERRPQWISRAAFAELMAGRQADPGLTRDLAELAPDTTDDLPEL